MITEALAPILALLKDAILVGDPVQLKSSGTDADDGMYLCAEQGGPARPGDPFVLTGRFTAGVWETWTLDRGKL